MCIEQNLPVFYEAFFSSLRGCDWPASSASFLICLRRTLDNLLNWEAKNSEVLLKLIERVASTFVTFLGEHQALFFRQKRLLKVSSNFRLIQRLFIGNYGAKNTLGSKKLQGDQFFIHITFTRILMHFTLIFMHFIDIFDDFTLI